jgi:hypothetical protein
VELVRADQLVLGRDEDELDDEERAALRRELEASMAEARAGHVVDAATVLAELRAMK